MRGEPSPAVELSPKCSVEAIQIPAGQTSQTECVDLPGDHFLSFEEFHTVGKSSQVSRSQLAPEEDTQDMVAKSTGTAVVVAQSQACTEVARWNGIQASPFRQ